MACSCRFLNLKNFQKVHTGANDINLCSDIDELHVNLCLTYHMINALRITSIERCLKSVVCCSPYMKCRLHITYMHRSGVHLLAHMHINLRKNSWTPDIWERQVNLLFLGCRWWNYQVNRLPMENYPRPQRRLYRHFGLFAHVSAYAYVTTQENSAFPIILPISLYRRVPTVLFSVSEKITILAQFSVIFGIYSHINVTKWCFIRIKESLDNSESFDVWSY